MKCSSCRYYNSKNCLFPLSQDGSNNIEIIMAAMPDFFNGGKNCLHYYKKLDNKD